MTAKRVPLAGGAHDARAEVLDVLADGDVEGLAAMLVGTSNPPR
jgi:hypothetical protein